MSDLFSSIPVRKNGEKFTASWVNVIRSALVSMFGLYGFQAQTFAMTNGQSSFANITGLSFDSTQVKAAIVDYFIERRTDTASSEVIAVGSFEVAYSTQDSQWRKLSEEYSGDDTGVTLDITTGGQCQYKTTSISGSNAVDNLTFRVRTWDA